MQDAVTIESIRRAAERLSTVAHRTPVLTCRAIDEMAGRKLFFKCENFQKVGAFKFRGAMNAVSRLEDHVARKGVVTHSSGNHAQALALAAKLRGIPAHIVMPSNAPRVKRIAVEGYGGMVHECEPTQAAREENANRVVRETGGTLIPPYDHPDVIAGQGTAALELFAQIAESEIKPEAPLPLPRGPGRFLDAIIAPVGGGGLMSGTAIAARGINPTIRILGAEPAGADDAARSLATGVQQPMVNPTTVADGLRTGTGELTWPIIRDHVEHIYTVDDESIIRAMRLVWERMKVVIEPSAAVPFAAILSDAFRANESCETIGVILTGGNIDLDALPWLK